MYQTVFAGHNLYERTEIHDGYDRFVVVDGADFRVIGDSFYPLDSSIDVRFVRAGNHHCAVVLDVDLSAGFGSNLLDGFAALADNFADLIGVDGNALYTRCVWAQFLAWTV